jgi:hypothetical protein
MNTCRICNVYEAEHHTERGHVCVKCKGVFNLQEVETVKRVVCVTTDRKNGVHGIEYTVFFTMIDNGETKQTLYAEASSSEQVDEVIVEVQAFFPDDYEFEFS